MSFLDEKDKKRNKVLMIFLGLSLFAIPFANNPAVRALLALLVIALLLNVILIIVKLVKSHKKRDM